MAKLIVKRSWKSRLWAKVIGIFVIEPVSFSTKRRINFRGLGWLLCGFLALFCLAVFLIPTPEEQTHTYHERTSQTSQVSAAEPTPQGSVPQNPLSPSNVHAAVAGHTTGGGGSTASNRNTSMIIARDNDLSTTLPPGTKFAVKLTRSVTVTDHALPVIGLVVSTVSSGNSVAIPEGAQLFGDASLDSESERVGITWKSMMFPDGRSKALSALALGADNQAGIEGDYHSDALKNTAGQIISRFVGGLADGAISRTPFGASQGGIQNGLLQGVADTAKDRTNAWSEEMKKPRAWVELHGGAVFQVLLSQPFTFRDPGGVY